MDLITWDADLQTGIAHMDHDHMRMVEMINRLHDATNKGAGKVAMVSIMRGLLEYTRDHFRREEDAMKYANYPDREEHCKEHAYYAWKVKALARHVDATPPVLPTVAMDFLWNWLRQHIKHSDRKMAYYLSHRTDP